MVALWSFLLDRLDVERSILRFPSPLHASEVALRILAKGNWKIESFLWGGRFGRSLLCPGRAEKKTRGSCPPTGCLPVDRNKLGPDSWRDERGVCDRTDRQTDTHTHRDTELKPCGPPGPRTWPPARMKIASLGLAGGRWYDRNSLRTPTMQESREKTTSSVFLSTCSNAVHAQFHWHAYTRNTRPCDVVCLQSKHFRSIAGMIAPPARRRSTSTCAIDRDRGETWNTSGKPHAVACCTSRSTASTGSRSTGMQ